MRVILFGLLSLFLSACSTPQLPITQKSHAQALQLQQHNKTLKSWDLTATTALTSDETSYSLSVFWHQNHDQYHLRFDAPFTTGVLKVKGKKGYAEITVDNKTTIKGISPEDLIAEATQFNIPVTGLMQWIRGIPHNDSKYQLNINGSGDTKNIKQDGWLIEYDDWELVKIGQQNYRLPSHINLSQAKLNIRISPSNWVKPIPVKTHRLFSDLDAL